MFHSFIKLFPCFSFVPFSGINIDYTNKDFSSSTPLEKRVCKCVGALLLFFLLHFFPFTEKKLGKYFSCWWCFALTQFSICFRFNGGLAILSFYFVNSIFSFSPLLLNYFQLSIIIYIFLIYRFDGFLSDGFHRWWCAHPAPFNSFFNHELVRDCLKLIFLRCFSSCK